MLRWNGTVTIHLLFLAALVPACADEGPAPGGVDTEVASAFAEGQSPGGSRGGTCGQIEEFPASSASQGLDGPFRIVTGPDNLLWFTTGQLALGRMSTDGQTHTPVAIPSAGNSRLIVGPDDNIWVSTFQSPVSVTRVSRHNHATLEIPLPDLTFVADITAGPGGAVWALGYEYLARVTPSGRTTLFPIPTDDAAGSSDRIVTGPDGNLWFTRGPIPALGFYRVTPRGDVTRFPVTTPGGAIELAVGPDHAIWYTHGTLGPGGNGIGRITMDGVTTNVVQLPDSTGAPTDLPLAITAGPDRKMYFTTYLVDPLNYIGQVTLDGTLRKFEVPTAFAASFGITTGPDGNLWFTETNNNLIGRLTPCQAGHRR
ncbi:MAG TPA: hypothetical protein VMT03_12495 [Polyangia bacterium]|nr:hypothetical protein [Polyangia bacterium]